MAPFGKLYSYPGNFRAHRAQVAAALNGLEVELADFKMGETNKSADFLVKFPMGKVPAFEGADGFCIAEGAAICQYLAGAGPKGSQLVGSSSDVKTQARIAEWSFFAETELVANFLPPALMTLFKMVPYDAARYAYHIGAVERACGRVEIALQEGKKYLVGDSITLADVMVVGILIPAFRFFVDAEMRAKIPHTVAYVQSLAGMKEFADAYGALEMCETRVKA